MKAGLYVLIRGIVVVAWVFCYALCDDERFCECFQFEREMVSVYATSRPRKQYHVRNVGMILVGSNVQVAWADGVRQGRRDKVELTPLLTLGPLEVYSAKAWAEAAERVRS